MQYEFLKNFPKRMKNVSLYARLVLNTTNKTTWNQYQFTSEGEQLNLVFSVLLFIMEQSLKEEPCTLDDIGVFIDNLNTAYWGKPMSFEESLRLADFIVNTILSNDGKIMHFEGYDFEQNHFLTMPVGYVKNRVVYTENDIKRTSYSLTDDGYNLMLSTLEIENNLKLTIHELIFQMHLEKQSYDKAVDDVKNIFMQMRIQLQKIKEAMWRIRRNALEYSVAEYEAILNENLQTITDTKSKFENYKEHVRKRAEELEQESINVKKLSKKEEENLTNLRIIGSYLGQTIDEHQKILNTHLDLKDLYTKELEQLVKVASIKRFSITKDVYDKILVNPMALQNLEQFLGPLFNRDPEKIYHPVKSAEFQKNIRVKKEEDTVEKIEFDEAAWEEEQRKQREALRRKYESCLSGILKKMLEKDELLLSDLGREAEENSAQKQQLIPSVDIFKEVMVELLKGQTLEIDALREERSTVITDSLEVFEPNVMILDLLERYDPDNEVLRLIIMKKEGEEVIFKDILCEDGNVRNIRCSNVIFRVERKNGISSPG